MDLSDFEAAMLAGEDAEVSAWAAAEDDAPAIAESTTQNQTWDNVFSYKHLVTKPNMQLTVIEDKAKGTNRADILYNAKINAAKIGRITKDGIVAVPVTNIGQEVRFSNNGLKHGLDRRMDVNGPVTERIGEILHNAIRINELTPKNLDTTDSTFVLTGAAKNKAGVPYVVEIIVNRATNEVVDLNILHSVNAKTDIRKESVGTMPPSSRTSPLLVADSDISIANLLDLVNSSFPDVLPTQMIKTGMEDIPTLKGLGEAINKKQALSEFLADLEEIHKAYARSAYQDGTVSDNRIRQDSENSNPQNEQSQRWDNSADDTAREAQEREIAYTRLQSENEALRRRPGRGENVPPARFLTPLPFDSRSLAKRKDTPDGVSFRLAKDCYFNNNWVIVKLRKRWQSNGLRLYRNLSYLSRMSK